MNEDYNNDSSKQPSLFRNKCPKYYSHAVAFLQNQNAVHSSKLTAYSSKLSAIIDRQMDSDQNINRQERRQTATQADKTMLKRSPWGLLIYNWSRLWKVSADTRP